MRELRELEIRGAPAIRSVEPIAGLTGVRRLALEGLRDVSDLSPSPG